jgi:hypothetical protein
MTASHSRFLVTALVAALLAPIVSEVIVSADLLGDPEVLALVDRVEERREQRASLQIIENASSRRAARGGVVSSLNDSNLSAEDKRLLRLYQRGRSCPESLKNYIPGFYELCLAVTEDAVSAPRVGLVNPGQFLRSRRRGAPKPEEIIDMRLQVIKEGQENPQRRESVFPGRPTPYQGETPYSPTAPEEN